MAPPPRQLNPEEQEAQAELTKWKTHHMNQVTRGSSIPTLKGSLTRAKNAYLESYRLCQEAIKDVDDEEPKAQQLQQLEEWELAQLEWQDKRDHYILIQENPEVRDDSQPAKDIQYESLYGRA